MGLESLGGLIKLEGTSLGASHCGPDELLLLLMWVESQPNNVKTTQYDMTSSSPKRSKVF